MASSKEPHANLERLIGSSERSGLEPAKIDFDMAQVAILWLQDLARELDGAATPTAASIAGEPARQEAAHELRTATDDFAEAFLAPPADPAATS